MSHWTTKNFWLVITCCFECLGKYRFAEVSFLLGFFHIYLFIIFVVRRNNKFIFGRFFFCRNIMTFNFCNFFLFRFVRSFFFHFCYCEFGARLFFLLSFMYTQRQNVNNKKIFVFFNLNSENVEKVFKTKNQQATHAIVIFFLNVTINNRKQNTENKERKRTRNEMKEKKIFEN